MSGLSFAKEEISTDQPKTTKPTSLLSSTIASNTPDDSGNQSLSNAAKSLREGVLPSTASAATRISGNARPALNGYTVYQVVVSCVSAACERGIEGVTEKISAYEVRIGNDDGSVDTDFPELDLSVPITSVGVTQFVLCLAGTDDAVLRICLPENQIRHHACESDDLLRVACYPCNGVGRASSFMVDLSAADTPVVSHMSQATSYTTADDLLADVPSVPAMGTSYT